MRRIGILLLILCTCFVLAAWSQVPSKAKIVSFDVPGAAGTYPCCINDAGMIAGKYLDVNSLYHGFVRAPSGRITTFDVPDSVQINQVHGINQSGMITGEYAGTDSLNHGFLRTRDGNVTTFDPPGVGQISGLGPQARSINLFGVVAGDYWDENFVAHGYIRTLNGNIRSFDAPGAGSTMFSFQGTYVNSINRWGVLSGGYVDSSYVGHQFVLTPDGKYTVYDAPDAVPGGTYSTAINFWGTVVGHYFDTNNVHHGFLRTPSGKIIEFDAPGAIAGTFSSGINRFEIVVGYYGDQNNVWHAYLRTPSGKFVTVDAPEAGTGSGQGTGASCAGDTVQFVPCASINARGVIAGGYLDANNVSHGFVRVPSNPDE